MSKATKAPLTYKAAGVDIEKGQALVSDIKNLVKSTHRPGVLSGIGGFGAAFELPVDRYKRPVLVSCTDGVGTKLKLAIDMDVHDTIGIDLVAMCVNDLITLGAEPLFFLDYFATGRLDRPQANAILTGIARGCQASNAALIGGETAEMPGLYQGNDYDLAGFCVGVVEKDDMLSADKVTEGDAIIALASSGAHANGYSLIRAILSNNNSDLSSPFNDSTLGQTLLTPTRIYVNSLRSLCQKLPVMGLAHITGGGLLENIPRALPPQTCAQINTSSWDWPDIFHWLQAHGQLSTLEMRSTFNLGVGMVVIVKPHDLNSALAHLAEQGETAWHLGVVGASSSRTPSVTLSAQ